jgi:predicted transcriptional regulator
MFESTTELAQNKLILLYSMKVLEIPIPNSEFIQFILENLSLNYFMIQQYLSELAQSSFIEICPIHDDQTGFVLTKLGEDTLLFFQDRIPEGIRQQLTENALVKKSERVKARQVTGHYFKKNDAEYIVTLKVVENETLLFSQTLNVVSQQQAKMICKNWHSKSGAIYNQIVTLLTTEKSQEA